MSLVGMITEDDDNHTISSLTNSDDDMDQSNYHAHRSCSRYASCNRNKHQNSSIDSDNLISLSNNSKLLKGKIRSVTNEPGHRQKYDGNKWRRICSNPDCVIYLNGGVYYEKWLCRKHYLLSISMDTSTESDNLITKHTEKSQKLCTRKSNKTIKPPKRGDMLVNANGIRQKYNGKFWRPICNYNNCKSFLVVRGYCHRHDMEIRKNKSKILSSLNDIEQESPIVPIIQKPKKGDIQCIRQKWNGTKWYSLCHYYTQDCSRRSRGIRSAHLCDIHYKEYIKKQKDKNLIAKKNLSSKAKRKQNTIPCQIEQYIQTDITYPLEANDLQQGCFLIDDDTDDQYQSESSQLRAYIKKEEENYLANKRKFAIDVNSLPINCKLEITKIEF